MALRKHFPASSWIWRTLSSRMARRVCGTILGSLLLTSVCFRIYSYVLTRRIQAVISGLSNLQIDETTEEEAVSTVPYLIRGKQDRQVTKSADLGNLEQGMERYYYVEISNKPSWTKFEAFAWRFSGVGFGKYYRQTGWIFAAAELLGYRYVGFGAGVQLLNGKVSSIGYGIAGSLPFPQAVGNFISVRSFHARWAARQAGFEVSSTEEESPQFNVEGNDRHLSVSYAAEASPALQSHVFRVNLSCFWRFSGCNRARQLAPPLWQDKSDIEAATMVRLKSVDPCPDRILAGRLRYLPDVNVVLLESKGFETKDVIEDGVRMNEVWTHYTLIEVLRGRAWESWEAVKNVPTVLDPVDYTRRLPNNGLQWAKAGERVLVFSDSFDSCRIVAATPSALTSVRNAIPASRRAEDEVRLRPQ